MKFNDVLPVLISISILVFIAVVQRYSRVIAGVTATMPVTIPLSLWVVYSASRGERIPVETYTRSLVTGIIPTVAFTVALWLGARAGLKFGALIVLAYGVWALTLVVIFGIKRWIGM